MSVSVTDFVEEYEPKLLHLKGFQHLLGDLKLKSKIHSPSRASIDNSTCAKSILSHYYDDCISQPIAKYFKLYALKIMGPIGGADEGKPVTKWSDIGRNKSNTDVL